jgi:hypothetical protein
VPDASWLGDVPNSDRTTPHVPKKNFRSHIPVVCPMNAMLTPEVLICRADDQQSALPRASKGVLRYVWESRYGSILIEVSGTDVFVNGQRVEPHIP